MEWYLKVVRDNYANFEGRARRKEFWMFALFNLIIAIGINIIQWIIGFDFFLSLIYSLAIIIPSIAVGVRRLQDIGKSWVFLLIGFIPILGALVLIYFFVQEGDQGPNEYGPDPKAGVASQPV